MSATAVRTSPEVAPAVPKQASRIPWVCAAIYAGVLSAAILHHEPWADEAQAWLLARDVSLWDLWVKLLHYEGSPGLWHTLLHALIALQLPYSAYNFVSGALAFAAVLLLLRYAPLPLPFRLFLPFTYYLCYQYAVVARSYSLLAPLLFAAAVIYPKAKEKTFSFTALLCLLAGISVHGLVVSAAIWLTAYGLPLVQRNQLSRSQRRRVIGCTAVYAVVIVGMMLSAWPAKDVAFVEVRGMSRLEYLPDVARATLEGAFTGEWKTSIVVLVLSLPFLWAGGGMLFFGSAVLVLIIFGTLVYSQVWHFGIFFLAWLFAIWISCFRAKITLPTMIALGVVIGCQCYWTAQAISWDWRNPYSGSKEAARHLQQSGGLKARQLYAIGYPSTAIQPYFPSNIYTDVNNGGPQAYWDWSKRNMATNAGALFSSQTDAVLVGYKDNDERSRWNNLLALLGYQQTHHFEGHIFWKTRMFESHSFDLFGKLPGREPIRALTPVNDNDPSGSILALNGFTNLSTSLAPGLWVTIHGANLASTSREWAGIDFKSNVGPQALEGVSITVNGKPAALRNVNPGEVSLQIPTEAEAGAGTLVLTTPDGKARQYAITLAPFAPTLKVNRALSAGDGTNYISAHFADGTEIGPSGDGRQSRAAKAGDLITVYGIGFGPLATPLATGQIAAGPDNTANPVTFRIGQATVKPSYAGSAPGLVGVYQFNLVVPQNAGSGDVAIDASVAGVSDGQSLLLPLQKNSSENVE
jgi:uncharacterized protein (TIGR03437 family)